MTAAGTRCFHADLGFPQGWPEPSLGHALVYTLHAHKEAQKDRVERWLPVCVLDHMEVVEVEVLASGAPVKWVLRMPIDKGRDLVLVVTSEYMVKTAWVNRRDDLHHTLDMRKYDRPSASRELVDA